MIAVSDSLTNYVRKVGRLTPDHVGIVRNPGSSFEPLTTSATSARRVWRRRRDSVTPSSDLQDAPVRSKQVLH